MLDRVKYAGPDSVKQAELTKFNLNRAKQNRYKLTAE